MGAAFCACVDSSQAMVVREVTLISFVQKRGKVNSLDDYGWGRSTTGTFERGRVTPLAVADELGRGRRMLMAWSCFAKAAGVATIVVAAGAAAAGDKCLTKGR